MTRRVLLYLVSLAMLFFSACSNSTGASGAALDDVSVLLPDTLKEIPPSGFFTNPFVVILSDSSLHCEKGGEIPSVDSPAYKELKVDNSTTFRCVTFENGEIKGGELIRTYVIREQPAVASVFITAEPGLLFDPDTGIYMDGKNAEEKSPHYGANYWLDKEIPIFIEFVENKESTPAFAKFAGLKIFGGYSRAHKKKSVAITFREKYGDKRLRYPLFPELPKLNKFKSFLLRNNGNNYHNGYIRDRLASSISEGLDVDYQRGRFVVVYYNGEYFGIHDLRERSNRYYFETHYGMDPDEIDLLRSTNSVSAGSSADYISLLKWLESHHLDDDKNYNYVASQIDVGNYINYLLTELFADNRDWPGNNLKKWRGTNPLTKWKWFLYDLDFGFGFGSTDKSNIFEFVTNDSGADWPNGPRHTLLLRRLLENDDFKRAFINRMSALLVMNFESSRVLAKIEKMMSEIETEIPLDQKRWEQSASYMANQLNITKNFARNRPSIVFQEMRDFFKLGSPVEVTLSVDGRGEICVHDLPLDSPSLTIRFFEGLPVTLRAQSKNGGVFVGWSDGENDEIRTIMPEKASSLTALFK